MSEQSGRSDPADQPRSDKPPGAEWSRATEPAQQRGPQQQRGSQQERGSQQAQQPPPRRSQQEQQSRRSQQRSQPPVDLIGDLQRWFIKSSARNMRSQVEDQVRRTFGGQRQDKGDVWDVATTEIPPEVGEAPECQWCPICRAARHMRDSGAGPLSGAGDAVASAVQDAVRAVDALLGRAAGGAGPGRPDGGQRGDTDRAGTRVASGAEPDDGQAPAGQAGPAARPDSLTGEHGPVGWKPGDRLATTGVAAEDPWATATTTAAGEAAGRGPSGGVAGGPDGRGHEPDDRG